MPREFHPSIDEGAFFVSTQGAAFEVSAVRFRREEDAEDGAMGGE